jgi:photosystem II stability/assembly factor-like uncharacterized protein
MAVGLDPHLPAVDRGQGDHTRAASADEIEALFKEARRRRRRRRALILATIGLVVVASVVGLDLGNGGPNDRSPVFRHTREPGTGSLLGQRSNKEGTASKPSYAYVQSVGLADNNIGWAMGGDLSVTTNGGRTWHTVTPPLFNGQSLIVRLAAMDAIGRQDLWLPFDNTIGVVPPGQAYGGSIRGSGVLRSTDGGRTWKLSTLPGCIQACGGDVAVSFLNSLDGFASIGPIGNDPGVPSILFSTVDGGATWTQKGNLPAADGGRIEFTNPLNGWYATGQQYGGSAAVPGPLYRTGNGGLSWQPVRGLPSTDVYEAPSFFGVDDGVVLGRPTTGSAVHRPVVYTTVDGGTTWSAHPAPSDRATASWTLNGAGMPFSVVSMTHWKLFVGPALYSTFNAGKSWTRTQLRKNWTAGPGTSVAFSTASDGIAMAMPPGCSDLPGQTGEQQSRCFTSLFSTTDGGAHWVPRTPTVTSNHWKP